MTVALDALTMPVAQDASQRSSDQLQESPDSWLVEKLLLDQADLTAVERFARRVEQETVGERHYRALLPVRPPASGQQYAFEVDLDRCSGCKACVAACHTMNGLDEQETWRDVGLLHGGSPELPVLQHVTSACHHCLEPACLSACPVNAYEKDERTGIVIHLDDQCFGCQYCTLACPYDAPKYHKGKGIVRKCDMCSGRLAAGEPPACVASCPHEAIRITLVDRARIIEDGEANLFLPGAPEPDHTLPTTLYRTQRALPRNLLPADYFRVQPEHAHWPLVVMLVLTQLSVGGFLVEWTLGMSGMLPMELGRFHPLFSLTLGLIALVASTFHLGRPHLAFRALLGLRHSWLSREILAFGIFAKVACLYATAHWLWPDWLTTRTSLQQTLLTLVAVSGVAGVVCSVMVYQVVKRPLWSGPRVVIRFGGSTLVLGLATAAFTMACAILLGPPNQQLIGLHRGVLLTLSLVTPLKLAAEMSVLGHRWQTRYTPLRRSAVLMTGPLRHVTWLRVIATGIGMLISAWMLTVEELSAGVRLANSLSVFVSLLVGELAERYLFFTAVVRRKMPGGLAA